MINDTRTHCPNGHVFDETNNYKNKEGYFRCRICNKLRMRKVNSTPKAKAQNVAKSRAWINAHREHYREYCRNRRTRTNQWLKEYKSRGCSVCGETFLECLDFHHRDPNTKSFDIGTRASAMALKKVMAEVAKCDVICANCHRKLHAAERVASEEGITCSI